MPLQTGTGSGTFCEVGGTSRLALAAGLDGEVAELVQDLQSELFDLGADLAVPEEHKSPGKLAAIELRHVEALERAIDALAERLPSLATFILPGGGDGTAWPHLTRTVCRRAERRVVALAREEPVGLPVVRYLNRLVDLLFVMARYENQERRGGPALAAALVGSSARPPSLPAGPSLGRLLLDGVFWARCSRSVLEHQGASPPSRTAPALRGRGSTEENPGSRTCAAGLPAARGPATRRGCRARTDRTARRQPPSAGAARAPATAGAPCRVVVASFPAGPFRGRVPRSSVDDKTGCPEALSESALHAGEERQHLRGLASNEHCGGRKESEPAGLLAGTQEHRPSRFHWCRAV